MSKLKVMQDGKWINFEDSIYYEKVLEENVLLKYKINKAIEYINEYKNGRPTIINGCEDIEYIESDILLDILEGKNG